MSVSAGAGHRDDRGDTLIEILVALVIIGVTTTALLGAFLTSIASSAEHRRLANIDTVLRSFAGAATYQIQLQPSPLFKDCATPSTYHVVAPYPSDASPGSAIEVFAAGGFPVGGSVAVSIAGTSVPVASGGTVPSSGNVAALVDLPTSGPIVTAGATSLQVTATKGATVVSATAPFTVTSSAANPAVTTNLPGCAVAISEVQYWNGAAFVSSCTPGGNQSQLITVTATATSGSDTASFVVMDPAFVTSTPPTITSTNLATFTVGTAGSFTVQASGAPTPNYTWSGSLPTGVTLTDNDNGTATIAGTPATGTAGSYAITITASNGVLPNAVQSFTLQVYGPPTITSANAATFVVGTAGSFPVTTTGFPTPALTLSSGTLPSGLTFKDNGNGTATISGTPAAGTGKQYALTITASNGTTPYAQPFTLTVDAAPAITSAASNASAPFTTGQAGSFTVSTTGFPNATLSESGTLPAGVTFVSNGNGTATISGTPAAGTGGAYPVTITAANGVAPNATQSFTLYVDQALAITAANPSSYSCSIKAHSSAVCVTLTTSGYPAPTTCTPGGAEKAWATCAISGNTVTVTVTVPNKQPTGPYTLNVTIGNGVSSVTSQNITVTVT